jgi:hypothetical protein
MEAISCRKTIQEIAADHFIHPIQVSQWKRRLLNGQVSASPSILRRGCCLGGMAPALAGADGLGGLQLSYCRRILAPLQ